MDQKNKNFFAGKSIEEIIKHMRQVKPFQHVTTKEIKYMKRVDAYFVDYCTWKELPDTKATQALYSECGSEEPKKG